MKSEDEIIAETWARYEQGKEAWNSWANALLKEREAAEADGSWNSKKEDWENRAAAIFSSEEEPRTFEDDCNFSRWVFPGSAVFESATFEGFVSFNSAMFIGDLEFAGAAFERRAWFVESTFNGDTQLDGATFNGIAWFDGATFKGFVSFNFARLEGDALFSDAKFKEIAWFSDATFKGDAWFDGATFKGDAWFDDATFKGHAGFSRCDFESTAIFQRANFRRRANFEAIKAERAFSLADATFGEAPNFIQANFSEAPRLDNLHFRPGVLEPQRFWGRIHPAIKWGRDLDKAASVSERTHLEDQSITVMGSDSVRDAKWRRTNESVPARFRALRRLADQGHDHASELDFFAGEMRGARWLTDFPYPNFSVEGAGWGGFGRYWLGWLYEFFSDFGRSPLRPFLWWAVTLAVSAFAYLGTSPFVDPSIGWALAGIAAVFGAIWFIRCFSFLATPGELSVASVAMLAALFALEAYWPPHTPRSNFFAMLNGQPCFAGDVAGKVALPPGVRTETSAAQEAWHLATRNAFLFFDGGPEAGRRIYGCLYGFEAAANNVAGAPLMPSRVSLITAVQKFISFAFIFLFGLALRNQLRMK